MTDVSNNFDADLEREIDEEIMRRLGGGTAETAEAFADPKQIFCQSWPTVKQALEALKVLAAKYAWAIQVIIIAGDKAHVKYCGA